MVVNLCISYQEQIGTKMYFTYNYLHQAKKVSIYFNSMGQLINSKLKLCHMVEGCLNSGMQMSPGMETPI